MSSPHYRKSAKTGWIRWRFVTVAKSWKGFPARPTKKISQDVSNGFAFLITVKTRLPSWKIGLNVLGVWHNVYCVWAESLKSLRNVSIRKFDPDCLLSATKTKFPISRERHENVNKQWLKIVLWLKFQLHGDARKVAHELPAWEVYTRSILVLP